MTQNCCKIIIIVIIKAIYKAHLRWKSYEFIDFITMCDFLLSNNTGSKCLWPYLIDTANISDISSKIAEYASPVEFNASTRGIKWYGGNITNMTLHIISKLFQYSISHVICNHVWNSNEIIQPPKEFWNLFQNYFRDSEHVRNICQLQ